MVQGHRLQIALVFDDQPLPSVPYVLRRFKLETKLPRLIDPA
mgnify:FL=1